MNSKFDSLRRKSLGLTVVVLLTASALAACGDSESSGPAPEGDNVATGEPLTVGALAPLDGAAAFPESGAGVEAAEYYINNFLGGVNGRELDVDLCAGDGTPETAVNCANQFVADKVPVVLDAYDLSMQYAQPILVEAKVPFVGTLNGTTVTDTTPYPNAFYLTGPGGISAIGSMSILERLGKSHASLAITDAPATHDYVDMLLKPVAAKLGVDINVLYVDEQSANWKVVAATLLQEDPDVAGSIALSNDGCTKLFGELRAQGYDGTIFAGPCSAFIDDLGSDAAGAVIQSRTWLAGSIDSAPAETQEQLQAFIDAMKAVGEEDSISERSLYAFAGLVTLADRMSTIEGDITSESVRQALESIKDYQMFAGSTITCDGEQWPGAPSACSKQAVYFEVQDDGSLKPGEADGYFDLDPSLAS